MGKLLLLTITLMVGVLFIQDSIVKKKKGPATPNEEKYCAAFRDGKMVIVVNDKVITSDIKLQNGSTITTTGSVVRKNGSAIILKSGECVNREGNFVAKASLM